MARALLSKFYTIDNIIDDVYKGYDYGLPGLYKQPLK